MSKKAAVSLIVTWRMQGEETINFTTKGEAEQRKNEFETHMGNKIVKMRIVENK